MAFLDPAVEQQLAEMSEEDFYALTARVRPPAEQPGAAGRAAAQKRFPGAEQRPAGDGVRAQVEKRFGKPNRGFNPSTDVVVESHRPSVREVIDGMNGGN